MPATVRRIVRLGFEVRVELRDDAGTEFTAQLTRGDVDALSLHEGDRVLARTVRPSPVAATPRRTSRTPLGRGVRTTRRR